MQFCIDTTLKNNDLQRIGSLLRFFLICIEFISALAERVEQMVAKYVEKKVVFSRMAKKREPNTKC